jgi:hypothetical protein
MKCLCMLTVTDMVTMRDLEVIITTLTQSESNRNYTKKQAPKLCKGVPVL